MKKLFYIIICSVLIGVFASCGSKKESDLGNGGDACDTANISQTKSIVEIKSLEAAEKRISEYDSIIKKQEDTISSIEKKLNTLEKENNEIKGNMDKILSWRFVLILVSIISILGFIVSIIALFCARKYRCLKDIDKKIEDVVSKEVNSKLAMKKISYSSQKTNELSPRENNKRIRDLEERVKRLETNKNREAEEAKKVQTRKSTLKPSEPPVIPVVKYAKIDNGEYFMTLFPSNQEGCAFKITIIDESRGEFTLVGLHKIQSANNWQDKVKYEGEIGIKDASGFEVLEKGICERMSDGDVWRVTKPLKIKLLK